MPPKGAHKAKEINNFNVYKFLDSNASFLDWESIILFYSALHCVDAFFSTLPTSIHPRNHKYRNKMVSRYLGSYASDYLYAYNISRLARYSNIPISQVMKDACLKCYNDLSKIV